MSTSAFPESGRSIRNDLAVINSRFQPMADILANLDIGASGHSFGRLRYPNCDCNILPSTSATLSDDRTDAYP